MPADGSGEEAPAGVTAELPRLVDDDQSQFPIDEYGFTTEGYADYQDASLYLQAHCLRRFGVEVPEPGSEDWARELVGILVYTA